VCLEKGGELGKRADVNFVQTTQTVAKCKHGIRALLKPSCLLSKATMSMSSLLMISRAMELCGRAPGALLKQPCETL
jgi:hypothetical protein